MNRKRRGRLGKSAASGEHGARCLASPGIGFENRLQIISRRRGPLIEHALQTAEAIRAANGPRWFIVTGLVHDLGKILCLFGEPQWAVVGDTFPVGCRFSPAIVYSEFFTDNPD